MIEVEIKLRIKNKSQIKEKLIELGFLEYETLTETDTYFDTKNGNIRLSDQALRIRETINHTTKTSSVTLNFKGKKLDNISVTRPEFETTVSNGESMFEILKSLGYHPVEPKVIKLRQELKLSPENTCSDPTDSCIASADNVAVPANARVNSPNISSGSTNLCIDSVNIASGSINTCIDSVNIASGSINACIDSVTGLGDFLELESVIENDADKDGELAKLSNILSILGYSMDDTTTTSYLSALQKCSHNQQIH